MPEIQNHHLNVLRLLEQNPAMTQRELAQALGVSMGKTNYCLKALIEKGWLKLGNFNANPNKWVYAYLLTPKGIIEKAALTRRFLVRKQAEYAALKAEIETLNAELNENNTKGIRKAP
jgi:EPS-associated MarR family transcriptional regulator